MALRFMFGYEMPVKVQIRFTSWGNPRELCRWIAGMAGNVLEMFGVSQVIEARVAATKVLTALMTFARSPFSSQGSRLVAVCWVQTIINLPPRNSSSGSLLCGHVSV